MKTVIVIPKPVTEYHSEILPDVVTTNPELAKIVEWADANPTVWKIVTQNRSREFGANGSYYMGCSRGVGPAIVLDRAYLFYSELYRKDPPEFSNEFWRWRAAFTLQHYCDKGFKSGLFEQFDIGEYRRGCTNLDYTPETLDEVIDRFIAWCESGSHRFATVEVRIDGKTVRKMKRSSKA